MFRITKKDRISDNISRIKINAPHISKAAKPGQFLVVVPDDNSERIPLTIADTSGDEITVIFQVVGATTKNLDQKNEGDFISHVLGPLGEPSDIENFGKVVVVAGGVGIAEIYPIVKALKSKGNEVLTVIGARNKSLLIYEKELSLVSGRLLVATDDGSSGKKGLVTDILSDLLNNEKDIKRVIAVGPVPMMKACSETTRSYKIKTMVSLNTLMLDATGMCGVCRVTVGGKTKFACVDGPEFDGHQVDFEELSLRLKGYLDKEKEAFDHVCRLEEKIENAGQ